MPVRILRSRFLNPSLTRVRTHVHDVVVKNPQLAKPPDPRWVQVDVYFTALYWRTGTYTAIQFDPADCGVFCDGDAPAPPVQLAFRGSRYTGLVRRGRLNADGLPNYYNIRVRAGERDFRIAIVPVVQRVTIQAPGRNSSHFADADVDVTMSCSSWPVLWHNSNPHYQFEHSETVILSEQLDDGRLRTVARRTVPGGRDDSTAFPTTPVAPYARSGSNGTIDCVTEYRSNYLTEGPVEFLSDGWISSSRSRSVPITWIL